jgi:hypothetical protein
MKKTGSDPGLRTVAGRCGQLRWGEWPRTTGADLDSDGYTCHLDGGARSQSIGINETEVMTDPATGEHSAELSEARG